MDGERAAEIWRRLTTSGDLAGLGLDRIGGRIDLRGLRAPAPSVSGPKSDPSWGVSELTGLVTVHGARWSDLDLSGSRLDELRFFDSRIERCFFEKASCKGWRMWGTTVADSSFRSADLRGAALGGLDTDRRKNAFTRVDFSKTDLRRTVYQSADFTGCRFSHSKLSKVDFQGSVFVDCVFEGRLEDVQFYRQGFRGEDLHPNEMKGVDLRAARLHFVEFRDLDMEDVVWPEDDDHIIVNDYRQMLDRVLRALSTRTDDVSRSLRVLLDMKRKWAGPKQRTGVVSKSDLREAGGEAAVELFLDLCARHAQR